MPIEKPHPNVGARIASRVAALDLTRNPFRRLGSYLRKEEGNEEKSPADHGPIV
jgi:hypothetical protein